MATDGGSKQIVFSLHGIRTRGAWQKAINRQLTEAGFVHVPLDFGFFRAMFLLMPCCRRWQVDWFRDQYTSELRNVRGAPSIIAHSFGTYLVARSMEVYGRQIAFDRIILCGSIVRPSYEWSRRVERQQCTAVLNHHGKQDWWAWVAKYVINDAGESGVKGFTDTAQAKVTQIGHAEFRHSDYFYDLNYQQIWIPFLLHQEVAGSVADKRPPANLYFRRTMIALALLLIGLIWGFWQTLVGWFHPAPPKPDNITFSQMAEDHARVDFLGRLEEYKAAHVGKEIHWEAIILDTIPGGYRVIPSEHSEFKVDARYDADDAPEPLRPGDKVKIRGVIDDINPLLPRLKHVKFERLE